MSRYTSTVFEILQYHATPQENVANIADMTAISTRTLFANAPLNVLSETARANFITQFTLHYLTDELGFETLVLWQLKLAEKLYNNSDYINAVYDNLIRQAYSEYTSRNVKSNGTRSTVGTAKDVRVDDITVDNTSNGVTNNTSTRDNTGSQGTTAFNSNEQTNDLTDTVRETGTDTQAKSGTDISSDTGTQTNTNNLTDTQTYNSTDTQNYNSQNQTTHNTTDTRTLNLTDTQGYDSAQEVLANNTRTEKATKLYTIENEKSFDNRQREKSFTNREHEKSYVGTTTDTLTARTDTNSMGLTFDTPQGTLDDLRNPGGIPGSSSGGTTVGKGIDYATGQDYNYFSAAAENDGSTWNSSTNTKSFDGYKETGKETGTETESELGKEIDKQKFNIDGTTNKDELAVESKFGSNTTTRGTKTYDGDVTFKSGEDSLARTGTDTLGRTGTDTDNKTGYDSLAKTGSDTLTKTGTSSREDNLTHLMTYDNATTDTKNLTTTGTKTGTVSNTGVSNNLVTDDLHETAQSNGITSNNSQSKSTGTVTNDNTRSDFVNSDDNVDDEMFKVNFTQWLTQNSLLDKVWEIFDDLFMILYN